MPTHAEILKSMAENAISRMENNQRVLCSMPGTMDTSSIEAFYETQIQPVQNFLKALSFSNEIDVELCEILDKADYVVTAAALDNEVKEYSANIVNLQRFILSTPVNPENPAEDKMKEAFDVQWAMIEAKLAFYELYNKVRL